MTAEREGLAEVLREHFVMWHDLPKPLSTTLPTPPGEWRCQCGLKFGFSDSAIDHQADALADLLAARVRRVRAEAVMQAEGDIRDYRAAYSRCIDLAEEWQALDFEPATQADLSTLATINRCGIELARALEGDTSADRIAPAQSAAATEENRP